MNKQKVFCFINPLVANEMNEYLDKGWYVSESYDCSGWTVFLLEYEPDEDSHSLNELRDYVKAKGD